MAVKIHRQEQEHRERNHRGVTITRELYAELEPIAAEDKRSVSGLVTKVLSDFIRSHRSSETCA